MRILSAATLSVLVLAGAGFPAAAQEDEGLPGVRVTIMQRSFLSPGNQVRPASARDYAVSNLTGNTFTSENYSGVEGFQRHPLPYPMELPNNPMIYVLRAPDRVR